MPYFLILVHSLDELQDYICVSQQKYNGDCRAVLFVKMRQGIKLTPEIKSKIEKKVDEELWEGCVPELILEIPDIPVSQKSWATSQRKFKNCLTRFSLNFMKVFEDIYIYM